jgi:ribosome-associated protein
VTAEVPGRCGSYLAPVAEALEIDERLSIPLTEIELRASRSSGPGGQHANVTASRVEAVFDVRASASLDEPQRALLLERAGPLIAAVAQDARGQARNRELALQRLAEKIAAGLAVPRRRRPTGPSRAARQRRLERKRQVGERKRARRPPAADD